MFRAVTGVLAVAVLASVAACSANDGQTADGTKSSADAATSTDVQVSVSSCGDGWHARQAGAYDVTVHNTDSRSGSVDLVDPRNDAVYAEVEPLAAGTTAKLRLDLGAGRYAFRCAMEDEPMVTGSTFELTGSHHGDTPAVRALDQSALIRPTQAYEKYVIARLARLAQRVQRLRGDVVGGDLAAARADWLPAQLEYLSLGAAYSAFGDLDAEIDARADGLPRGVHDPHWHGLHRIEYGLWHNQSAAQLRPIADRLVRDVAALRKRFPDEQLDPREIAIRAHEITEDAVQFTLTGRDDYGAHAGLPALRTDIAATRTVLRMVHNVLAPRYRQLGALQSLLTRSADDVDAMRRDGRWPALDTLSRMSRERVNADFSELAERLAPVASILEPRRTR